MADAIIAIVGSAQTEGREYEPALRNVEQVKQACLKIGGALAVAGYRIMVYSSEPRFIEADVVEGYASSGAAKPKSIVVRYPSAVNIVPRFKEQDAPGDLFDFDPQPFEEWQITFYTSLKDVDGVVLLGGSNSALITGLVAQMNRKPLLPIATFGGSTQTVWLTSRPNLHVTDEEYRFLNAPVWVETSAATLVKILGAQIERTREEARAEKAMEEARNQAAEEARRRQSRELQKRSALAGVLLLAACALAILGIFRPTTNTMVFGVIFFLTPLLAGAAGGIAIDLLDFYRAGTYKPSHATTVGLTLGAIAGLISGGLFATAQWASNPEVVKNLSTTIPPGLNLLILFELIIGFIAGFTLEAVFLKLTQTDVTKTGPINPPV